MAHHSYWNLGGHNAGTILDHELTLYADQYTPGTPMVPDGRIEPVTGTPFDFTNARPIGRTLTQVGGTPVGYDHNFVVNGRAGVLRKAAEVYEPTTGRVMEVWTTEPGMQLYTGNYLDGSDIGKGGKPYRHRYGFCLETQHHPDAPNRPEFPSTVLRRGARFRSTTVYKFSAR
jgi:aldose 1-epimerase